MQHFGYIILYSAFIYIYIFFYLYHTYGYTNIVLWSVCTFGSNIRICSFHDACCKIVKICVLLGAQCTKHFVTPSIPHWCKETTPHAKACVLSFSMLHWCARSWCHSASCADVKETVLLSIPCWCKGSCATQHVTQHAALTQKKLLSFSMTCWCKRSCCHSAWRADAKEAAAHSACWAEIIGNPGEGPIAMNLGQEAMNVTSLQYEVVLGHTGTYFVQAL